MIIKDQYTENEKLQQAYFVLTIIQTWLINTEKLLKEFLFNLALMNHMAAKGYKVSRSSADNLIYAVKIVACEFLINNWPTRCCYHHGAPDMSIDDLYNDCCYDNVRKSILYFYCDHRQYSFHVHLDDDKHVRCAKADEWDGIKYGWSLTDQEYKAEKKPVLREKEICPRTKTYDFIQRLRYLKAAKEYLENRTSGINAEKKFWIELLTILPHKKLKNKCIVERNLNECLDRYLKLVREHFTDKEITLLRNYPKWQGDEFEKLKEFKGFRVDGNCENLLNSIRRIADALEYGRFHVSQL